MAKKSLGKTNKRMGSNAERFYAKIFRSLGFSHCLTSRQGSRIHDDAGIDLVNLPLNVQIKAGQQRGLNIPNTLRDIKERISKMFPADAPEHLRPLILIHRRRVGRGKRRQEFDDTVTMSFKDFQKLLLKK